MTRQELYAIQEQVKLACAAVKNLRDMLRHHKVIAPGGQDFNDALCEIVSVDHRLGPFAVAILTTERAA